MNVSSQRIKEIREQRGISLREMARRLNISHSTLKRYEDGNTKKLDIERLKEIASILNVSSAFLMGWEEDNIVSENYNYKSKSIVDEIKNISEKLEEKRQTKVLYYAKNELKEQNTIKEDFVNYSVQAVSGAAAGVGYSYDNNDIQTYYTDEVPPKHDYATVVCGDSMEPLLSNGDIVYIKSGYTGSNGDIYVIDYDGKSFIKKLYHDGDRLRLVSLNDTYEPIYIPLPTDTYLNIVGKVIGSFKPKKEE